MDKQGKEVNKEFSDDTSGVTVLTKEMWEEVMLQIENAADW